MDNKQAAETLRVYAGLQDDDVTGQLLLRGADAIEMLEWLLGDLSHGELVVPRFLLLYHTWRTWNKVEASFRAYCGARFRERA